MKTLFSTCLATILLIAVHLTASASGGFIKTADGLAFKDLKIGQGETAFPGDTAFIHLTGWLAEKENKGKELYNSRRENKSVSFVIGTDKVIKGWNEGVTGMRVGGSRLLRIPPELAYGEKGVVGEIPPGASLIFIIELIKLE